MLSADIGNIIVARGTLRLNGWVAVTFRQLSATAMTLATDDYLPNLTRQQVAETTRVIGELDDF